MLQNEQDLSTKRNAFQFLCNHAEERAVNYLLSQIDNVALWGDILQMAVLDLIRKVRTASSAANSDLALLLTLSRTSFLSPFCQNLNTSCASTEEWRRLPYDPSTTQTLCGGCNLYQSVPEEIEALH